MDFSSITSSLVAQGPLGIVLIITGWVAWSKDKELQAEKLARIDDAKNYTKLALELQSKVIESVDRLGDILDEMKKSATQGRFR